MFKDKKLYIFHQISSYGSGQSNRTIGARVPNRSIDDSHVANIGGVDRGTNAKDKILGFSSGRADHSLPPDATSTLFVEGLPSNCTRREVARILSSGSLRSMLSLGFNSSVSEMCRVRDLLLI